MMTGQKMLEIKNLHVKLQEEEKQILKEMQLIYAEVKGKKTQKKAPPLKKRPAYC